MITISGAGDDGIVVDGDIVEEFDVYGPDAEAVIGCSDGTLLRVWLPISGPWRIAPLARGAAELSVAQAVEGERSDVATLSGCPIEWVACAKSYARNETEVDRG